MYKYEKEMFRVFSILEFENLHNPKDHLRDYELLDEISEFFDNKTFSRNIMHCYWKAGKCAEKLIKTVLGEEGCQLPIDIELLAKELGVEVKEADLNSYQDWEEELAIPNKRIGQLVLRKNSYTNKTEKIIYTERMVPLSSKRFAVAYELSHYLLHQKETEKERYENYFIMPMIPLNMEELKIDIFSVFLLIPISQFFKEFKEFVEYSRETQRVPVATEDWLRYLSEKAVLSEFYTACGYQYLRSVGYWIYLGHKGEAEDIKKLGMPIKEQSEIRKRQRIFLMKK